MKLSNIKILVLLLIFSCFVSFYDVLMAASADAAKFFELGLIYKQNKEYSNAITEFTRVINSDPSFKPDAVYNERGIALFCLKKYNEAISDYSKSISYNSGYVSAYCNRGSAYYNLRNFQAAIADFTKVIELEPGFHSGIAYVFRASSYFNMGKFQDAAIDYSKAIEINPSDGRFYNDRGNVYYYQDKQELAKLDFQKAIELNTNSKATKTAKQKLQIIAKQQRSGNKMSTILRKVDSLKKEWGDYMDKSGKLISEENFNAAQDSIDRSIYLAAQIKELLLDNNLPTAKADAMEKLSLTYRNLNNIFIILGQNTTEQVDLIQVRKLIAESYQYLDEVEPSFIDVPVLEKICWEIRRGLDNISGQLAFAVDG